MKKQDLINYIRSLYKDSDKRFEKEKSKGNTEMTQAYSGQLSAYATVLAYLGENVQ